MNDWETDRLTGRQTGSPINTDREIDRHKQVGRHNFAGRQINRWAYIQQVSSGKIARTFPRWCVNNENTRIDT